MQYGTVALEVQNGAWRAKDSLNGGEEAQNRAVEDTVCTIIGRRFLSLWWGPASGSGSALRGEVWSGFRSGSALKWKEILIKVMQIRNPAPNCDCDISLIDLFCYLPVCLSMSNILAWKTGSTASTDTPVPDKSIRLSAHELCHFHQ